jgi:hypothetical protein
VQGGLINVCPDPEFTVGAGVWPDAQIFLASNTSVPANAPSNNVLISSAQGDTYAGPLIPVIPGETIDFECEVAVSASGTYTQLGLVLAEKDAGGNTQTWVWAMPSVTGNFTGWQLASATWVVPAGIYSILPSLSIGGAAGGIQAWFSSPKIIKRTAALVGAYTAVQSEAATRAAADAALTAATLTRPNLCPDVTKWSLWSGAYISNSVWGVTASSAALTNGTYIAASPSMACTGGATYVITGDSMLFATTADAYFDLQFFDSSGTLVLDSTQNIVNATHDFSTDAVIRNSNAVQVTAPSTAVSMYARFVIDATNNVTAAGFRMVKVERGSLPATPYTQEADVIEKLDLSGGTMTGPLALVADPTIALQAATKQYVDAKASSSIITAPYTAIPKFAGQNMFIVGQTNMTAPTTMPVAANTFYLIPFVAPFNMTINGIGVDITTAGSANYLIGIYSSTDNTMATNTLLVKTGANPTATGYSGGNPGSYQLVAGNFYLAAFQSSAASGSIRAVSANALFPWFGKFIRQAYFYTHATFSQTYNGSWPASISSGSMILAQPSTIPMIHIGWA